MKRFIAYFSIAALAFGASSQSKKSDVPHSSRYEIERDMPTFLDRIHEELTYPLAWGNSDIKDYGVWNRTARDKVIELMLTPPKHSSSWAPEVVAEEKRDGYTARKVAFNLTDYSRVEAYVLTPDGDGPFPALVALHDHGGHYTIGKEKMIRPFEVDAWVYDDADKWADNLYEGQYLGDYLAKNGYVVISVDALFWGDRGRKEGPDGSKHANIAGNFQMLGRNMSAWMNFEDMYTAEFLATLPKVDPERIGCIGLSMGAYRSWMLAALSPIIKAGVAVCWMTTTDIQLSWEYGREQGGFANCLLGVRNYLDYPHVASLACPKPMFFLNGETDKLFPTVAVNKAFGEMRKVWESQGASDNLRTEIWDIGHQCHKKEQSECLKFLDKHLK